MTLLASALAAAAVVAIAGASGFGAFAHAWSDLHFGWLVVSFAAALLAIPAYAIAYRTVTQVRAHDGVRPGLVAALVVAGFAPFAAAGGFALDKRAIHAIEDDEQAARTRVLGMGALEWAVLAPAAWLGALVLLVTGDPSPMPSLLWPWVIAVPIGFALGLWLAAPPRLERIRAGDARWRAVLGHALRGVGAMMFLARRLTACWPAWLGMGLYWALDIASLYGAIRFVGLSINAGELVVAYATGYALTRRSMPMAGAGVTEAFLTFALHWAGQPIAPALAATVVYRAFNVAIPTIPALLVHRRVAPLLDAADAGRTPAQAEVRRASAALGEIRG
jgi:uncharacterized membrane protein YbhN (UPF0104 family)